MSEISEIFTVKFYLNYWQQYRALIIYSVLLSIFSFGYALFNFNISIDEEIQSFSSAFTTDDAIAVGRWGLFVLNCIFIPHSVLPYLPTLISLCCLSFITFVFLASEKNNLAAGFIFGIIFITNPIHSHYLAWNGSVSYTIGMAVTLLSYLSFQYAVDTKKNRLRYYIFAILFLGFAISVYQALMAFFLVFMAYFLFMKQLTGSTVSIRKPHEYFIDIVGVVIFAFLFYKAGDIAARNWLFDGTMLNKTNYLDSYINWGKIPLKEMISGVFNNIRVYLTGIINFGDTLSLSSKTIVLIIPLVFYFVFSNQKPVGSRISASIFLVILLLSPFAVDFFNGRPLPARSLMSFALMSGFLWLIAFRNAGRTLRKILFILAIMILINNTYINTRLFYSENISWQADRMMANRIAESIFDLDPPLKNGKIDVLFFGGYQYPSNELFLQSEVFGASFFGWDGGNPVRLNYFFKTLAINEFRFISRENFGYLKKDLAAMPAWPDKGSVTLINEMVIVKLSDSDKVRVTK